MKGIPFSIKFISMRSFIKNNSNLGYLYNLMFTEFFGPKINDLLLL